jgi:hypothetical protein
MLRRCAVRPLACSNLLESWLKKAQPWTEPAAVAIPTDLRRLRQRQRAEDQLTGRRRPAQSPSCWYVLTPSLGYLLGR